MDDHTGTRLFGTGCKHLALVILHHAHSARAVNGQIRMITEGRDVYFGFPYKRENVLLAFYRHFDAVYCHIIHKILLMFIIRVILP